MKEGQLRKCSVFGTESQKACSFQMTKAGNARGAGLKKSAAGF